VYHIPCMKSRIRILLSVFECQLAESRYSKFVTDLVSPQRPSRGHCHAAGSLAASNATVMRFFITLDIL
jgi:hypothetical protein